MTPTIAARHEGASPYAAGRSAPAGEPLATPQGKSVNTVDAESETVFTEDMTTPHRYEAERSGWRTCRTCGQGANASVHRHPTTDSKSCRGCGAFLSAGDPDLCETCDLHAVCPDPIRCSACLARKATKATARRTAARKARR